MLTGMTTETGMRKLHASYMPVSMTGEALREELFSLFARYYADVDYRRFRHDLMEKDGLILLSGEDGAPRGFSTIGVSRHTIGGEVIRALFSGDTIIDHRYWGEHAFAIAWLRRAGEIWRQAPDAPLYWFLVVKGYRTYRYLPVFAKEYYPSFRNAMPERIRNIRDHLATERFGGSYDPQSGIVHFPEPRGRLRRRWLEPPENQRDRPEARFFRQMNPHHARGDELVCLAELSPANMPPFAARIFEPKSER